MDRHRPRALLVAGRDGIGGQARPRRSDLRHLEPRVARHGGHLGGHRARRRSRRAAAPGAPGRGACRSPRPTCGRRSPAPRSALGAAGADPLYGAGMARLDATAPALRIRIGPGARRLVRVRALDEGTIRDVRISINGRALRAVRRPVVGVRLPALRPGANSVTVTAEDMAGNVASRTRVLRRARVSRRADRCRRPGRRRPGRRGRRLAGRRGPGRRSRWTRARGRWRRPPPACAAAACKVQRRQGRRLQVVADARRAAALERLPGVAGARTATTAFADAEPAVEPGRRAQRRGRARPGRQRRRGPHDRGARPRLRAEHRRASRRLDELPPPERLETLSFDAAGGLAGTQRLRQPHQPRRARGPDGLRLRARPRATSS